MLVGKTLKILLKDNYSTNTNKLIKSLPDYLVIDKEKKEAFLVEVKFAGIEYFEEEKTQFIFRLGVLENYLEFWKDAILILCFNTKPYCKCVRLRDIDVEKHIVFSTTKFGSHINYWKFDGIYQDLHEMFPKIKPECIQEAIDISKK